MVECVNDGPVRIRGGVTPDGDPTNEKGQDVPGSFSSSAVTCITLLRRGCRLR